VPEVDFGDGPFDAIVMTSANAARAIVAHGRFGELCAVPVVAVGLRTRDIARAVGFARVETADGDAAAIAALAARTLRPPATLLYLAGADRAADLETILAGQGFVVRTVVVYRAVTERLLPSDIRDALANGSLDGVLHYSRRSAQAFCEAAAASGLSDAAMALRHACLSGQIADVLREAGATRTVVAAGPREADLLTVLGHDVLGERPARD
jgi:uroporphyrinogen-III synthase